MFHFGLTHGPDVRVYLGVFPNVLFLGLLDLLGHGAEDGLAFADLVLDCDLVVGFVDSLHQFVLCNAKVHDI